MAIHLNAIALSRKTYSLPGPFASFAAYWLLECWTLVGPFQQSLRIFRLGSWSQAHEVTALCICLLSMQHHQPRTPVWDLRTAWKTAWTGKRGIEWSILVTVQPSWETDSTPRWQCPLACSGLKLICAVGIEYLHTHMTIMGLIWFNMPER